jgi:hypothetical protein
MANRNFNRDYDRGYYDWDYDYNRNFNWGYSNPNYDWNTGFYNPNYNYGYNNPNFNAGYNHPNNWNTSYYGPNTNYWYNRGNYNYPTNYRYNPQFNQGYNPNMTAEDYYDYNTPDTWTYTEWWLVPGPYTGVGPQGYQRSDQRIEDDINNRLTQHGRLNASNINVDVNNGVATLNGSVDTRKEKRLAEDIVDSVPGVMDVHNNLKVSGKGQMGPNQKQIQCGTLRLGMDVVGKNGNMIGSVKQIRDNDFLVDRSMARDIFVPFSACTKIDNQVHLSVTADKVDNQGWQEPTMA